jgi:hypothetical protein
MNVATKKELAKVIIDGIRQVRDATDTLNASVTEFAAQGYLTDANLLMPHVVDIMKDLGAVADSLGLVAILGRGPEVMTEQEVNTIRLFGNLGNGTSVTDAFNAVKQVVDEAKAAGKLDPEAEAMFAELSAKMHPRVEEESDDLFSSINQHLGL